MASPPESFSEELWALAFDRNSHFCSRARIHLANSQTSNEKLRSKETHPLLRPERKNIACPTWLFPNGLHQIALFYKIQPFKGTMEADKTSVLYLAVSRIWKSWPSLWRPQLEKRVRITHKTDNPNVGDSRQDQHKTIQMLVIHTRMTGNQLHFESWSLGFLQWPLDWVLKKMLLRLECVCLCPTHRGHKMRACHNERWYRASKR